MTKVLFVIAPENFKDSEYLVPKKILEDASIEVVTCSLVKEAKGVDGTVVNVDILLDSVNEIYDGLVFIGGSGAKIYFDNLKVYDLIKKHFSENKILGAICIAPSILGKSGILKGKRATVFSGFDNYLIGANYTGNDVEVDGNIITANGPFSAKMFGLELLKKFK